ncbi:MAG: leucine-rich repeat protein [Filifactor alocis]|nr:leucine-rich repeat protein [Filifactor alocis]
MKLPDSLQEIEESAFEMAVKLATVDFGKGIKKIGRRAFAKNSYDTFEALKSIDLPASIEEIGEGAFEHNKGLKKVIIRKEKSNLTIGANAFKGTGINQDTDEGIEYLPEDLSSIIEAAFEFDEGTGTITAYDQNQNPEPLRLVIPNTIKGKTVKKIGPRAFNAKGLESVYIPNTVEELGEEAFSSNKLTGVLFEDGSNLKRMEKGVFRSNELLESIELPDSLEEIPEMAFGECKKLSSVKFPSNLKKIGREAFTSTDITELKLPDKLEELGEASFSQNNMQGNKIKKLTLNQALKKIGAHAFASSAIEEISIPSSVEEIGEDAFGSQVLKNVVIEEGRKTIGKSITQGFKSYCTEIEFPRSLEEIEESAFERASDLATVDFGKGIKKIGRRAFAQEGQAPSQALKSIELPESIEEIGESAFENNKGLEKVIIRKEKSQLTIGANAFKGTRINQETDEGIEYLSKILPPEDADVIKDPMLKRAINQFRNTKYHENRSEDQAVTREELNGMEEFNTGSSISLSAEEIKQIKDISGFEHLINARSLYLEGTSVTDLTPIKDLEQLTELYITGRRDSYFTPTAYGDHTVWRAPISDISAISGLVNLRRLWVSDTEVTQIPKLKKLKNLKILYLMRNRISDITPLKDIEIEQFFLSGNGIGDWSPLKENKTQLVVFSNSHVDPTTGEVLGQVVSLRPQSTVIPNPFISIQGKYYKMKENEYAENISSGSGEPDQIKILKAPAVGNIIKIKVNSDTLLIDISDIKDKLSDPQKKTRVIFNVMAMQEEVQIERLYNSKIQVWNSNKEEILNDNAASYIWDLASGDYTYKVSAEGYHEVQGGLRVGDIDIEEKVELKYNTDNGEHKYPVIKSLKLIERVTNRVLGEGTIKGNNISIVVEDEEDRKLAYSGKAMILAETSDALSYRCKTEASPSSPLITGSQGPVEWLHKGYAGRSIPFKEDSITFLKLYGKGGLEHFYGLVIKEKPDQHMVAFVTFADKDVSLGSLNIPSGNLSANKYWQVYRFVQLVDDGQKAQEPINYIKEKYGKDAYLHHKGGTFEAWYQNVDWQQEFDFETPIHEDTEIYAKFSNSSNINEFPDPFTVWFRGTGFGHNGVGNYGVMEMKDVVDVLIFKNGEYKKAEVPKDVEVERAGEPLKFKLEVKDDRFKLAYIYAKYGRQILPVTLEEDGSFTYMPIPAQNSDIFYDNEVFFNFIPVEDAPTHDLSKQHSVSVYTGDPHVVAKYLSDERHFFMGMEGNKVRLEVEAYSIESAKARTRSGREISLVQDGEDEVSSKGIITRRYSFVMPDEDVEVSIDGSHFAPSLPRWVTFLLKDTQGNLIEGEEIEKLEITSSPYGPYVIEDITKPSEIISNASGREYNYMLILKDGGQYFGRFDLSDKDLDQIELVINREDKQSKKKEDVERLLEIARQLSAQTDKYTKASLEHLESAMKMAEHDMNLQNFNKAFFTLSSAIDGLETLVAEETYSVTVENASANKARAKQGEKIELSAQAEKDGKIFDKWISTSEGVNFDSASDPNTFFFMPNRDVVITALYKNKPSTGGGSGGSSGGGGSAGGSSSAPKPVDPPKPVEETQPALPVPEVSPQEGPSALSAENFGDVKNHWAKEAIDYVLRKGYFKGTSENTFSPNQSINRADFVTVLGRMSGADVNASKKQELRDVKQGMYYTSYINWAMENNIVSGVGNGSFGAEKKISRQEVAVILTRYLKKMNKTYPLEATKVFADDDQIAPWAKEGVLYMVQHGIMKGRGNDRFAPEAELTRAEVAQLLYKLDSEK